MSQLLDLAQIVLIDLSLAGDNALVVGMAVAALPAAKRKHALFAGIAAATLLRIVMALFAVKLLHVTGLLLAGGLLLAWCAWKMARELHHVHHAHKLAQPPAAKRFLSAVVQIVIADVSMSLDNVLAVAGVARADMLALVAGLILSIALMALASGVIAKLVTKYHWVAYVGIAIVAYTALHMIWDGLVQLGWFGGTGLA
jgi:YjbE family integral membrane protein